MRAGEHSRTALAAAFYRAQHHLHDEPKLLDDPFAHRLLTAGEMAAFADRRVCDGIAMGFDGDPARVLARTLRAATPASSVLARARYAEDRLAAALARGVEQYVVIGAGLDTFAFRRADIRDRVRVFELDHPESQALKRARLAAAGLDHPSNLHLGGVDFERESVAGALARLPFRPERPAVFSWLGVTMYLTRAAIEATWRAVASVAASASELVFDFIHPDAFSGDAPPGVRRLLERTRALGEPITTALDPATLATDLRAAGWRLLELLDPAEIDRRYFAMRDDGYRARPLSHFAAAGIA